ncbi:MAG: tetratricopeptide repeat protein [Deltaproteobacteria bacterium]|nr:tetratricopeptide repeat protein [Deltaproteobacteria bacterium]
MPRRCRPWSSFLLAIVAVAVAACASKTPQPVVADPFRQEIPAPKTAGNDDRYRLAEEAFKTRDFERAEHLLTSILKDDPGNRPALELLADVFIATDRSPQACGTLDTLCRYYPEDVEMSIKLAQLNIGLGRLNEAEYVYLRALPYADRDPILYLELGDFLSEQRDDRREAYVYYRLFAESPAAPPEYVKQIRAMEKEHPEYAVYWRDRPHLRAAEAALKKRDVKTVKSHLRQVVDHGALWKRLEGHIALEKNDWNKARDLLIESMWMNDADPETYYLLGCVYQQTGDSFKAKNEWLRTLELDPKHPGAIDALGLNTEVVP